MIRITRDTRINQDRAPLVEVLGYESAGSVDGASRWKRTRGCPREEYLYQIGIRRAGGVNDSLDFGQLYHLGLENFYRGKMEGDTQRVCIQRAWDSLEVIQREPGYDVIYSDLDKTLSGYFDFCEDDPWDIIAVEVELKGRITRTAEGLPLAKPIPYSARLDLVIRDRSTGNIRSVEHKSAKHYTEDLAIGYEADMQTLGQTWLIHKNRTPLLPNIGGVLVNVAVKPTKTKPAQYFRVEVMPTPWQLKEFEESLRGWAATRDTMEANRWPKALGNCTGPTHYFKQCSYFDLCHHSEHFDPFAEVTAETVPFGYELRNK